MISSAGTSSLGSSSKHLRSHEDKETVALSGGALLFASAFGNGLNYAFGIFLARTLGAEEFGLFGLALTIFNMVTLTVVFGMDIGATKFVSHHLVEGQQARLENRSSRRPLSHLDLVLSLRLGWRCWPSDCCDALHKPDLVQSLLYIFGCDSTCNSLPLCLSPHYRPIRLSVTRSWSSIFGSR